MNKRRLIIQFILILPALLTLGVRSSYSQVRMVYGSWYSEEACVCLTVNEEGFSSLNELSEIKVKYNSRLSKIKIKDFYARRIVFSGKDVFRGDVVELSDSTLVIKFREDKLRSDYFPLSVSFERLEKTECFFNVFGFYEEE